MATLLAAAVAMTAAACMGTGGSGAQDTPSPKPTRTVAMAGAQDPKATAPAAEVPGAIQGGTITVSSGTSPTTLDPTRASSPEARAILNLVTRGLTQYQWRAGKPVLVPDLAVDLGKPNQDFTKWTYRLRTGLRYHDGTEVQAADVAWAIKRQLATAELPGGSSYGAQFYVGGDKYEGPWKSGKTFAGVDAPDDRTVVINLRKPFADFPYFAALPAFTPIPEDKDTKAGYAGKPLATGPYKFEKYVPGNVLVLTRNEQWDPATDPARHQYVDRWIFKFGQSARTVQQRVIEDRDTYQDTIVPDPVPAELLASIPEAGADKRLLTGDSPCGRFAYLDTRQIPLEVRKALTVAWPIDVVNQVEGNVEGKNWTPATSLLPAGTPGREKYDAIGTGGKGPGKPAEAKSMLAQADEAEFELMYYYGDTKAADEADDALLAELEKAGFTVDSAARKDPVESGADPEAEVNLRQALTCLDWPTASSAFLKSWYPPANQGKRVTNPSFLEDPELAKDIDRIAGLRMEKAAPEWGKLDRRLMEKQVPVVPLGEPKAMALIGSKVGNAHLDLVRGVPDYSSMYLKE
jgi:peptide/nickel transport system substrate-binding protein